MPGSKLIYVRLEADDSVQLEMPHFCPRCSRLALSLGVAEWIVALPDSLVGYSSDGRWFDPAPDHQFCNVIRSFNQLGSQKGGADSSHRRNR